MNGHLALNGSLNVYLALSCNILPQSTGPQGLDWAVPMTQRNQSSSIG